MYWLGIKLSDTKKSSILKAASIELQKVSPMVLAARTRAALAVDVSEQLQQSKVPMVYFSAKHDVIVPKWNLNKILKVKPEIKVITFNTQHFLLQSAPHEAWEAIHNFITELA